MTFTKPLRVLGSIAVLVSLSACGHTLTAPEKDQFLEQESQVAFSPAKKLPPSGRSRMPLRAGQWVIVATTIKDASGEVQSMGYAKQKVIAVDGDTVSMEIETHHAGRAEATIVAFVVEHFPVGRQMSWTKEELQIYVNDMAFKRLITKVGDKKPTELPLNFVPLSKNYIKDALATGYRVGDVKGEPCVTDTLSSSKCMAYDYVVDLPGFSDKGRVEAHSAVPIVGFISQKSQRTESKVIAFGLTGAKGILLTE